MTSRQQVAVLVDLAAIVVFVTIGLVSHHKGFTMRSYARDVLPLGGCWFAAAALFRAYTRPGAWRLAATWAIGIPCGVLVRALVLGHHLNGSEAAFLGVCLTVIGLLVLLGHTLLRFTRRATPGLSLSAAPVTASEKGSA